MCVGPQTSWGVLIVVCGFDEVVLYHMIQVLTSCHANIRMGPVLFLR